MTSKRPYDRTLRQAQADATRARILEAVRELAAAGAVADLTVPKVAERAGVTVRTIYRYFPTRAELVDAMQAESLRRMGDLRWPCDVAELVAFPIPLFVGFDRERANVEALLAGGPLASLRGESKERRVEALRRTLAPVLDGLPEAEQKAALGIIKHLLSATAWQALREDVGLDGEAAGRAVSWAIRVLIEELSSA